MLGKFTKQLSAVSRQPEAGWAWGMGVKNAPPFRPIGLLPSPKREGKVGMGGGHFLPTWGKVDTAGGRMGAVTQPSRNQSFSGTVRRQTFALEFAYGKRPRKKQSKIPYNTTMQEKPKFTYPGVRQRARELRKNQTKAEKFLWEAIRYKRLGFRFRRQHVIERFTVDFYCMGVRVAIEVDGDIHKKQTEYDEARTIWSKDSDVKVMRFSNKRVENDLPGVLNKIMQTCKES